MVNARSRRGQLRVRNVAWSAMWVMVIACGYPELPRLSDGEAPPSCSDLKKTCGDANNESCCSVALVPGGSFYRSYDAAGYNDMNYPATVSTFVLDTYEVTVGRFRAFVNAGLGTQASPPAEGSGAHPRLSGSGWDKAWNTDLLTDTPALMAKVKCDATHQTWTDSPGENENNAMNCVPWYEAMAFCIWDGGYLPTEAEWNYAASGGEQQRVYPWSNPETPTTIDCNYANYQSCVNGTMDRVIEVGSKAANGNGRWNHSDLAGNASEWVFDFYGEPYSSMTCNDCANLTLAANRVVRGGSSYDVASDLRVARRDMYYPPSGGKHLGFRCSRTP